MPPHAASQCTLQHPLLYPHCVLRPLPLGQPSPCLTRNIPPQEYEARLYRTLLPAIGKAEVEAVAARLVPSNSAVFKTVEHRQGGGRGVWGGVGRLARAVRRDDTMAR